MSLTDRLTVSVDEYLAPVALPPLQALDRVWQTVSVLPIDGLQRRGMERMFGCGQTDDLERWMRGSETTDVPLALQDDSTVVVRIARGDRVTCPQGVDTRYVPERVQRPVGYSELWIVRDQQTGAEATGWLYSEAAALEWIRCKVQATDDPDSPTTRRAAQRA